MVLKNGFEDGEDGNEELIQEPSLRETIAAAFKENKENPEVVEINGVPETADQKAERLRDKNGQFKSADANNIDIKTQDPLKIPDANSKTAAELNQNAAPVVAAAPSPPRGWSAQSKSEFAMLPPHIQQDVMKREQEVDAGFAKYKGLDKHVTDFKEAGVEPEHAIAAYRAAEQSLANDFPAGIVGLCQQFDIHPLKLAEHLIQVFRKPGTGAAPQQQVGPDGKLVNVQSGATFSPEAQQLIARLEAQVVRLSKSDNARTQKEQQQQIGVIESEIDRFMSDPKNLYIDNVVDDMVGIIQSKKASGVNITNQEAYDAACWLNPDVRAILVKEQVEATSKGSRDKAAQKASQARKAALSVTGAPGSSSDSGGPEKSLREVLKDAFAEQRGNV